jgi:hypothetical protein
MGCVIQSIGAVIKKKFGSEADSRIGAFAGSISNDTGFAPIAGPKCFLHWVVDFSVLNENQEKIKKKQ